MEQARALLLEFNGPQAYFTFYLLLLSCGIGFPLNSDLLMIAGSMLAAMGTFHHLNLLVLTAVLGLLSGDAVNYFVARKYGKKLLQIKPFLWVVSRQKIDQAEVYLSRKGTGFLFFVRFLPLIRTVLYFTAGSLQVPVRTFFILDATSTLIYVPLLMSLAYTLSARHELLVHLLKEFQFSLLGFFLITGMTFLFFRNFKKSVQK